MSNKANYAQMERLVAELKAEMKRAREIVRRKPSEEMPSWASSPSKKARPAPGPEHALAGDRSTRGQRALRRKGPWRGQPRRNWAGARPRCLVHANDPMIKGGTVYPLGVKKTLRFQTIAMENRLPMIVLVDSAAGLICRSSQRFFRTWMMVAASFTTRIDVEDEYSADNRGHGVMYGGRSLHPGMSDHVVHVTGTGAIFLGGPPLVKAATGEEVTAEDLGGARVHCQESGVSDYFAEDDEHALQIVRDITAILPQQEKARVPIRPPKNPLYDPREIWGIVPQSISTLYDVREIIAWIADGSEFLEFKALYGPDSGLRLGLYPWISGRNTGKQRRALLE